tara:strand:- start:53 stop:646 length:594 start_codon:yes stop_codon:yes gene_type:complete
MESYEILSDKLQSIPLKLIWLPISIVYKIKQAFELLKKYNGVDGEYCQIEIDSCQVILKKFLNKFVLDDDSVNFMIQDIDPEIKNYFGKKILNDNELIFTIYCLKQAILSQDLHMISKIFYNHILFDKFRRVRKHLVGKDIFEIILILYKKNKLELYYPINENKLIIEFFNCLYRWKFKVMINENTKLDQENIKLFF